MEFANPFDDPQGRFYLLENDARQYSLWAEHCALPQGWRVVCEPQSQEACQAWLAEQWQNLQPALFASSASE